LNPWKRSVKGAFHIECLAYYWDFHDPVAPAVVPGLDATGPDGSFPSGVPCSIRLLMKSHRIYTTPFADVYPLYVAKAERKGRRAAEVDEILCWLTGYSAAGLAAQIERKADFATFFSEAPSLNPCRKTITGVICGVRIEEIEEPLMQEIRYLDKLVDELAKGRPMSKILRRG
jgi:hypothetical protein